MTSPAENAPTTRRYPLAPLAEMASLTARQTLVATKVTGKQYQLYRDAGMLRDTADRMAVRLGFHPYEVWPEMQEEDLNSHRARRRTYQRNWWRNATPEVRERVLASNRRYKREAAKAQALYLKMYRDKNRERITQRQAQHYRENRERILARQREYERRKRCQNADNIPQLGEAA